MFASRSGHSTVCDALLRRSALVDLKDGVSIHLRAGECVV